MYSQITIPKPDPERNFLLYVYASLNPNDIDTIAKVQKRTPIFIIDENAASTVELEINGEVIPCYQIEDSPKETWPSGIEWIGPRLSEIPSTEYSPVVKYSKVGPYTEVPYLVFEELYSDNESYMVYFSVIGVDPSSNQITNVSKPGGDMMHYPFKDGGIRHIYTCDDFQDSDEDVWEYLGSCSWDDALKIGDKSDINNYAKFGSPFISDAPIFDNDEISIDIRDLSSSNFVTLKIPNPWRDNNPTYNFRKIKSFKFQNVLGSELNEQYSDFSLPSYQSLLPLSLEKLLIMETKDPVDPDMPTPIPYSVNTKDRNFHVYEIIRKNGIYYNNYEHKSLGFNKYVIPLSQTRFPIYIMVDGELTDITNMPDEVIHLWPTIGGGLIIGDPEPRPGNSGLTSTEGGFNPDSDTEHKEPLDELPILSQQIEKVIGCYSEGSVQKDIKIQLEAHPGHKYKYTIYLIDVLGNISQPALFNVTL